MVVVGDGTAAERKASAFLRYGADVIVISPEATDRLRQMEADGLIVLEPREYRRADLEGVALVVCAGASGEVSKAVYRDADARGCPVNVGARPSSATTSSRRRFVEVRSRSPISTSGAAPSVAKRLRDEIKASYGEEWGTYVTMLGSIRALAIDRIPDPAVRDDILADVAAADLLSRIADGEELDAASVLAEFAPQAVADDADEPTEPEEQA